MTERSPTAGPGIGPAGGYPTITSMGARLGIGDFSRMTHLSVKALRHYHDVGLLPPAENRSGVWLPLLPASPAADRAGNPQVPRSRHAAGRDQGGADGT